VAKSVTVTDSASGFGFPITPAPERDGLPEAEVASATDVAGVLDHATAGWGHIEAWASRAAMGPPGTVLDTEASRDRAPTAQPRVIAFRPPNDAGTISDTILAARRFAHQGRLIPPKPEARA